MLHKDSWRSNEPGGLRQPPSENILRLDKVVRRRNRNRYLLTVLRPYSDGTFIYEIIISAVTDAGRIHHYPDAIPVSIVVHLLPAGKSECRQSGKADHFCNRFHTYIAFDKCTMNFTCTIPSAWSPETGNSGNISHFVILVLSICRKNGKRRKIEKTNKGYWAKFAGK